MWDGRQYKKRTEMELWDLYTTTYIIDIILEK